MDWKKLLGVAPKLARAVGGPAGAIATAAVEVVARALGVDPADPDALAAKVESLTAEDLKALKAAEQQFERDMRALDVEDERVAAGDRANARAREVALHDLWTPRSIAIFVMALFGYVVVMMVSGRMEGLKDPLVAGVVGTMIGYVSAKADAVVQYYFGSSAGSRGKDHAKDAAFFEALRKR